MNLERAAHEVVDEVDPAAAQEVERDLIEHDGRAFLFEHQILVRTVLGDVESILEPRAAAAIDADAQRGVGWLALQNLRHPPRGGCGHLDRGFESGFAHDTPRNRW